MLNYLLNTFFVNFVKFIKSFLKGSSHSVRVVENRKSIEIGSGDKKLANRGHWSFQNVYHYKVSTTKLLNNISSFFSLSLHCGLIFTNWRRHRHLERLSIFTLNCQSETCLCLCLRFSDHGHITYNMRKNWF